MQTLARVSQLKKSFGSTTVLDLPDMELFSGKVTAVVGANGSGKSTLVKTLSGYHKSVDSGSVTVGDETFSLPLPHAVSARLNLRFIHQDLGLVEQMSVTDNVCLSAGFGVHGTPINWRTCRARVQSVLDRIGAKFTADTLVQDVGPGDRVLVAMARILAMSETRPGVLVLDEPTAAVPPREVDMVLDVVRARCQEGWGILYIGHNLEEVLKIADFVTVLRDGNVVRNGAAEAFDVSSLSRAMLGEDAADRVSVQDGRESDGSEHGDVHRTAQGQGDRPILVMDRVSSHRLDEVSLTLHAGSVLGVVGLAGSGKSEFGRVVAGVSPITAGDIRVGQEARERQGIRAARTQGITYVPQDRLRSGLVPQMDVAMNISGLEFGSGHSPFWLSRGEELSEANRCIVDFSIVPQDARREVSSLSGGNQQKCVLARATRGNVQVLVLDEPTSGVDVGARHQIHEHIRSLSQAGVAIVLISNDLDEILQLADRIAMMRDYRFLEIRRSSRMTRQDLLERLNDSQEVLI